MSTNPYPDFYQDRGVPPWFISLLSAPYVSELKEGARYHNFPAQKTIVQNLKQFCWVCNDIASLSFLKLSRKQITASTSEAQVFTTKASTSFQFSLSNFYKKLGTCEYEDPCIGKIIKGQEWETLALNKTCITSDKAWRLLSIFSLLTSLHETSGPELVVLNVTVVGITKMSSTSG